MKTLICAAAILAAAIASGHAAGNKVPTDIVGKWCQLDYTGPYMAESDIEPCKMPGLLTIDRDGYSIFEMHCRFTSTTPGIDYKRALATHTMGAPVVQMTSSCKREDCRWIEWGNFLFSKGFLYVTRHHRMTSCPSG